MGHRRTLVIVFAVALSVVAMGAWAGDEHKDHAKAAHADEGKKAVTLEGEVLDLYCFMNHPDTGVGAEHAKCANSCIAKGLPIGLLVEGEVFLIIGKEHESAADLVAGLAGQPVRVTGTTVTHHGVKALEIKSIEKI